MPSRNFIAIPILFAMVILYLIYIGLGWTARRKNRGIIITDDDEDEVVDPRDRR